MTQDFRIRNVSQLIQNGGSASNQKARRLCIHAIQQALEAIDPSTCLKACFTLKHGRFIVRDFSIPTARISHINIIAVGKASVPMMRTALELLGQRFNTSGILVAPKGQKMPRFDNRVEIFHAGHPLPDKEGLLASRRVMSMLDGMEATDLLVCLISGGASALLPAPVDSITLQDKRRLTEELIRTRATIHEINTVRRHISALKGGRLVERCPAPIIAFIISDVAGNTLHDIASGLTAPDPSTFRDSIQILQKYNILKKIPRNVKRHLERGLNGTILETPKPASPIFNRVHNFIIADNRHACVAAENALKERNIPAKILTSQADMESRSLGKLLASIGASSKVFREPIRESGAMIVGGETTVDVVGNGVGGRNQHTALCALIDLNGQDGLAIAAFGTDGIDGNSTAAGAIVDGSSMRRAKNRGINPQQFIERSDSFNFFRKLNDNIITGRTGTNVGDLYVLVKVD